MIRSFLIEFRGPVGIDHGHVAKAVWTVFTENGESLEALSVAELPGPIYVARVSFESPNHVRSMARVARVLHAIAWQEV
jgi:hypothetical protein